MSGNSVTFVISCRSPKILRQLEQQAEARTNLDEMIVKTFRYYPNGNEKRVTKTFRLGDYFDAIELVPIEPNDEMGLKLIFHPRQGIDSYWKDLMMTVLRSINRDLQGESVISIAPAT